ncbi:MAG: hypothetical protein ACN4GM_06045 [Gammaproteobacteria bacterium]
MYISKIYLMFTAEILLILLAICTSLIIFIIKRPGSAKTNDAETEPTTAMVASYSEYLEKEILRNESKTEQQTRLEQENTEETPETPDKKQSQLLKLREMFLKTERASTEHTENENSFWDTLYTGLEDIQQQFKTTETEVVIETEQNHVKTEQRSEKVFYIETQGKKVDSEINRLKDILYDQDNTLSSLKQALDGASHHISDDNGELATLKNEIDKFEQQLGDSKMCMDVLEMENSRLQSEIEKLEHQVETQNMATVGDTTVITANVNQLKETLSSQEQQITEMNNIMDALKLDADDAETLKTTVQSFTQGSKEMMGCITILEQENDNLHQKIEDLKTQLESTNTEENIPGDELTQKISALEKDIIKKDVAYAKLQDEYSSIEKEYMSMYAQIHGDDDA